MALNYLFNRICKPQLKNLILLSLLICFAPIIMAGCAGAAASEKSTIQSKYSDIDKYIEQIQEKEEIPGIAIAIVQGSEILYCNAYGVTSVDNGNR